MEKPNRWRRTLVEALKQSRRAWLPELRPALELKDALEAVTSGEGAPWLAVAHCPVPDHPEWKRQSLVNALPAGRDVVIVIGPEGDFTPEEITAMAAMGAVAVTMGEHRLRTETAALFAVQAFHVLNALQ